MTQTLERHAARQWIPALAGYRALAALAVYVFHIVSIDPPGGLVGKWTIPLGNAAVAVFFVLSGFLIYRPYAAWAFGTGPPVQSWRFMVRRVVRIVPLYWVILTAHLFIFEPESANGIGEYLTAYGLVQNFRGALVFVPPFVAWSLCIELWFSLALPAIAAPLRKLSVGRTPVGILRAQLLGVLVVMALGPIFRVWALDAPVESGRLLWMPAYLDWFGYGLAFAVLNTFWQRYGASSTVRGIGPNAWIGIVIGVVAYWAVTQLGLPGGFVTPTSFQVHAQFALEGIMSAALVGAAIVPRSDLGAVGRLLGSRLFGWLGALSYGIYLAHPVIADALEKQWPDMSRWILGPVALAITLVASAALHRFVEKPATTGIDRLVRRTAPADSTESASAAFGPLPEDRSPADTDPRGWAPPILELVKRPSVMASALVVFCFATPLLSRPGVYVADARYELFADPFSRLDRMWRVWDGTRDLGRPAEEFWPGLTVLAAFFHRAGAEPWLNQRLIHGVLLALAATGALALSWTLRQQNRWRHLIVALLYAFGPFSAVYFIPSPLYVGYAIAPWAVVAVIQSSRGVQPYRWAGIVTFAVFAAGNADPPGLVFALVPALLAWLILVCRSTTSRAGLIRFTVVCFFTSALASVAGLMKTGLGAEALSHRLTETESVEAVAASSSFIEAARGSGFWLSYFSLGPTRFRSHQALFLADGWVVLATFAPIVIGIGALVWRRSPARLVALAWFVVGTVLVAGPFPVADPSPYGQLLLDLYGDHELAFAFRSTHKAGVIVALGIAVLGGWGMADLASFSTPRIKALRRVPLMGCVAIGLLLTQPFWRTPLYDPALTSGDLPEQWSGAADWFAEQPPTGRVLVLPASTNNGYRWGSVGDDLLDPIVPNRVVASTLPLSTPLPAELIDRLSEQVAQPGYQPGTLAPIAERLGISHVVIRNDLEWERQGVPRPLDFAGLRADPDLALVASFGEPGSGVVTGGPTAENVEEAQLPPIEVYALSPVESPAHVRLPGNGTGRRILVDGAPGALVDLAAAGFLEQGHTTVFAPSLEGSELDASLADTALIVLTDSNPPLDRRINYYGFNRTPAQDVNGANGWLPGFEGAWTSTEEFAGATVSSSADRWLTGTSARPNLAMDGDADSAWIAPLLAGETTSEWTVEFDPPLDGAPIEIELRDGEQRVERLAVTVNGTARSFDVANGFVVLDAPETPIERLEIRFEEVELGLSRIGIEEVRIDGAPPLTRSLPQLLVDVVSDESQDPETQDIPVVVMLGHGDPAGRIAAEFTTWHDVEVELSGIVLTSFPRVRCDRDVLRIDGEFVQVRTTPNGDGTGSLALCTTQSPLRLEPGAHRIEFAPTDGDLVERLVFAPVGLELEPVERLAVTSGASLADGDIVVSGTSFDADWRLDRARPFAADTLSAWTIDGATSFEPPVYVAERSLRIALAISAVGVWLAIVAIVLGGRFGSAPVAPSMGARGVIAVDEAVSPSRAVGFGVLAAHLAVVALGWFVGGVPGLVGAFAAVVVSQVAGHRWLFGVAALAVGVVAVVTALPVLPADSGLLDPTRDDRVVRAVIGGLMTAGVIAVRRLSDELRR